jgi:hypothetical protein
MNKGDQLMKYAKYGTMVLTLALIAGFGTPRAAAQDAFKGTFNLTTEAYWGPTLLPPGEYTITMSLYPTGARAVSLVGEDVRASILTDWGIPEHVSHRSALKLQQVNGVYVIRELDAGLVGRSYKFLVSKKARASAEQTNTVSQLAIPVSTSGN